MNKKSVLSENSIVFRYCCYNERQLSFECRRFQNETSHRRRLGLKHFLECSIKQGEEYGREGSLIFIMSRQIIFFKMGRKISYISSIIMYIIYYTRPYSTTLCKKKKKNNKIYALASYGNQLLLLLLLLVGSREII